ncbi:nucleotidyltransferase family protein [Sphingobium aromaticivastans]|uniref:nucleotidyltransferase family protein n=2 Tax=Sphingobium TaxID=165695 RepID=UPI00159C0DD6
MHSGVPFAQLMACLDGRPPVNVDWAGVIAAANQTLTTGTLAQRQRISGSIALPEDVRSFLAAVQARALERDRRMRDQLAEAVTCLNRVDIMPMLIKGAALLAMPGVDSRGRLLSDLDLIVPASALAYAGEALVTIGYVQQTGSSDPTVAHIFARSCDAGTIDLHCRLKTSRPRFDFARLAANCVRVGVGSGEALLPSPTAQALILILHDQLKDRDYWRGLVDLRHVLDIVALARTPEGIDWDLLSSWFPERQPQTALRTQLVTIEALLGIGVPPRLIRGWWPRLQHRRRMVQANWSVLGPVFTLLTLALDPPRYCWEAADGNAHALRGWGLGPGIFTRAFSGLQRIHRRKAPGKL